MNENGILVEIFITDFFNSLGENFEEMSMKNNN